MSYKLDKICDALGTWEYEIRCPVCKLDLMARDFERFFCKCPNGCTESDAEAYKSVPNTWTLEVISGFLEALTNKGFKWQLSHDGSEFIMCIERDGRKTEIQDYYLRDAILFAIGEAVDKE